MNNPVQKKPRNKKIRTQLILLMLPTTVLPLLFFGLLNMKDNRDQLTDYQRLQQTQLAHTLRVEIENFMESNFTEVTTLTNNITARIEALRDVSTIFNSGIEAILYDFLMKAENIQLISSQLFSTKRRPIANKGNFEYEKETAFTDQNEIALQNAVNGKFYLSPVLYSKSLGSPIAVYSLPVMFEGNPVAVVTAVINLAPLKRLVNETAGQNYEIFILGSKNRLIAQANMTYLHDDAEVMQNPMVSEFLSMQSGTSRPQFSVNKVFDLTIEGKQEEYLGTVTPLKYGWSLFVQLKSSIAFSPVQTMINNTVILMIVASIFSVIVGIFAANSIAKPVHALTNATEVLADRKFDQRIDIQSRNEIGLLADRFNWMSTEIQNYIFELKASAQTNKNLFLSSIRMISAAVDEKDPYTRGHSEKVREFSVEIARLMGLSADEIEKISISAILHDVGKIGVDDRVLKKAGKLTTEEYEEMKMHPEKGAYILSPIDELSGIIPGILYHHEKWDGTGYPRGLVGEEIPLPARIIAVADTFDAMTSDRPYQRAMDVDYVFKLLFDWAGKRFDPDVVALLFQAYEKRTIQLSKTRSSSVR